MAQSSKQSRCAVVDWFPNRNVFSLCWKRANLMSCRRCVRKLFHTRGLAALKLRHRLTTMCVNFQLWVSPLNYNNNLWNAQPGLIYGVWQRTESVSVSRKTVSKQINKLQETSKMKRFLKTNICYKNCTKRLYHYTNFTFKRYSQRTPLFTDRDLTALSAQIGHIVPLVCCS